MPHVTLPRTSDGLALQVMIGLNGKDTAALTAAGQPIPRPILVSGVLDTGSDITLVSPHVMQQLGLTPFQRATSQTASGIARADLYEVSLSIPRIGNLPQALLVLDQLVVMALGVTLPAIDVLVGLDVLDHLLLIHDGPRREFTLSD